MNPIHPRILIIDDNRAIHEDFGKILGDGAAENTHLAAMEDQLFGEAPETVAKDHFEISSAYQGRDGFELVQSAEKEGHPFAIAFVDVRMPPGWDGVETISRMAQVSPNLQTVLCTAYSDYSREQIIERLGEKNLLIIRKPVDPDEVRQLVCDLSEKWGRLNCGDGRAA